MAIARSKVQRGLFIIPPFDVPYVSAVVPHEAHSNDCFSFLASRDQCLVGITIVFADEQMGFFFRQGIITKLDDELPLGGLLLSEGDALGGRFCVLASLEQRSADHERPRDAEVPRLSAAIGAPRFSMSPLPPPAQRCGPSAKLPPSIEPCNQTAPSEAHRQ